jgi:iron(III) transport system substrate-binding protein
MRKITVLLMLITMIFTLAACQLNQSGEKSLTIYTERHYDTDQLLYDQFTEETGIEINLVRDEADKLITRLENEGVDTVADLLIIADAGRLGRAKDLDLLQPVESTTLNENVPENYQDPENYWYALTMRARVIVYHPDRVSENELSTYEDLTNPKWEGRIVTRSSSNIYNQSLMSSFIELWGEDDALDFAEGLVANFARSPQGNDRDQAKAVVAGEADLAIMNTYYIGRMLYSSDPLEVEVAETIRVFFPNQETTGTHVNVSGIGVVKHTEKTDLATKLIEYLTSVDAQSSYANANYEYPINPLVDPHELLASWGTFNKQNITLDTLSEHATLAAMLMNQAGWV